MLRPQLEFVEAGIRGVSGAQPRMVTVSLSPEEAVLLPPPLPLHAVSASTADMPTARPANLRLRTIRRIPRSYRTTGRTYLNTIRLPPSVHRIVKPKRSATSPVIPLGGARS